MSRRLALVSDAEGRLDPDLPVGEADELRARALRLLASGVGESTPVEIREQVAKIARRLAELEPPVGRWG